MSAFKIALKLFLLMTLITGILYPLAITLIAQFAFNWEANGSLLKQEDKIVGSLLIAQNMTNEKYFWPRPSAIDYDPLKPSGGSNLGPTSKKLQYFVKERLQKIGEKAPADLIYASGSGLDPHISLASAYYQIPRIAKARSINEDVLKKMVESLGQKTLLFSPTSNYVNVLLLNLELDENDAKRR